MSKISALPTLRFRADGTFRVLQLADVQDGPDVSPDTIRLLEAAIAKAKPDLVVFTGDQIRGYDPAWMRTFLRRRGDALGDRVRLVTKVEAAWQARREILRHKILQHKILQHKSLQRMILHRGTQNHAESQISATSHAHDQLESQIQAVQEDLIDDARNKVLQCFAGFLGPNMRAGVPFAATYGNHDFQCGILVDEQDDLYRTFPGCMNPHASADNPLAPEAGTFALPIQSNDGSRIAMSVVMVNSGDYAQDTYDDPEHADTTTAQQAAYMVNARGLDLADSDGYGLPSDTALQWLSDVQYTLRDMNGGNAVPSIAFQHIAPQEFYDCLQEVPAYTPHAVEGARNYAGRCYVLNPDVCYAGGVLGESIGCPDTNAGQVERMRATGSYFALYCGHDHKNAFVGHVHDMDLGYAPTCGFTSYGPKTALRGVRLFEFHEDHPEQYSTRMLTWGELIGGRSSNELRVFIEDHVITDGASFRDQLRRPHFFATIAGTAAGLAAVVSYVGYRVWCGIARLLRRKKRK